MIKTYGCTFKEATYPNGEIVVELVDFNLADAVSSQHSGHDFYNFNFVLNYESDLDLFKLMLYKNALEEALEKKGISKFRYILNLYMSYVPYSRMDRYVEGFGFSCKYVCNYINSLNFDRVYVAEVHSAVALNMLNNVEELQSTEYLAVELAKKYREAGFKICIVYPDKGAYKHRKIKDSQSHYYMVIDKVRDFNTGKLQGFSLAESTLEKTSEPILFIVVDDICVKGGTFKGTRQEIDKECVRLGLTDCTFALVVTHVEKEAFSSPDSIVYSGAYDIFEFGDTLVDRLNLLSLLAKRDVDDLKHYFVDFETHSTYVELFRKGRGIKITLRGINYLLYSDVY